MRAVYEEEELVRAIESTQSVASTNFGDSTVFIEKYLEKPRHIEFQLLADEHGNVIHVADRECSIQRRHQKLLEESPSPIMTEELRNSTVPALVYPMYSAAFTALPPISTNFFANKSPIPDAAPERTAVLPVKSKFIRLTVLSMEKMSRSSSH